MSVTTKINLAKNDMIDEGSPLAQTTLNEASELRDSLRNDASSVKDSFTGAVHQASDEANKFAHEFTHRAGEKILNTGKAFSGRMRDYPLSSSVIALGIGVILGMLYKRRA